MHMSPVPWGPAHSRCWGKVTVAISLLWVCWETGKEDHQRGRKNYPVLKKVLQDFSLTKKKETGATPARRNGILETLCSDQAEFDLLANYTTHVFITNSSIRGPGSAGGCCRRSHRGSPGWERETRGLRSGSREAGPVHLRSRLPHWQTGSDTRAPPLAVSLAWLPTPACYLMSLEPASRQLQRGPWGWTSCPKGPGSLLSDTPAAILPSQDIRGMQPGKGTLWGHGYSHLHTPGQGSPDPPASRAPTEGRRETEPGGHRPSGRGEPSPLPREEWPSVEGVLASRALWALSTCGLPYSSPEPWAGGVIMTPRLPGRQAEAQSGWWVAQPRGRSSRAGLDPGGSSDLHC